jgi:hypothetical protein
MMDIYTSVPSSQTSEPIDIKLISLFYNQPSAESQMRPPLRDVIFAACSVSAIDCGDSISSSGGIKISRKNSNKHREKNLLQCHVVHHESCIKIPEIVRKAP